MKKQKKNLATLFLAIIGGYLFYEQSTGVNFLIFTIVSFFVLVILNPFKSLKKLILICVPPLSCAVFIAFYPQLLSKITWLLSYLIMWSTMVNARFPIVVFLQGIASLALSPFLSLFQDNTALLQKNEIKKNQLLIYLISSAIILLFLMLYISSNPVFSELTSNIDLSFINFGFVFTVVWLFVVLYGLVKIKTISEIRVLNYLKSNISKEIITKTDEQEFKIANLSIWTLGVILSVVNLSDLLVIVTSKLPEGITYSQYVHQGFNTLIFTIILAVGLIIYFFRGQLNFHPKFSLIKKASTFWIVQNMILAGITFYKNCLYVQSYGLTYKRIAVFFVLVCVVIGLILSLKKMKKPLTNWFYFNQLSSYAFVCFILISLVPMDKVITNYNLNYSQTKDIHYLLSLENPDLLLIKNHLTSQEIKPRLVIDKVKSRIAAINKNFYKSGWQSWNYNAYTYKFLE